MSLSQKMQAMGDPESLSSSGHKFHDMSKLKNVFRSLHIIWAIIGVCATVVLAMAKGHPPGIIFVPVALLLWGVGHVFLWLGYKLVVRGEGLSENGEGNERTFPLTLGILSFAFGTIFFVGSVQIIITMMDNYNRQSELLIILPLWLPSSICFFGILLRKTWSRYLAISMFFIAALILLYQMIESIMSGKHHSSFDWMISITITLFCILLAQYLLRSPGVKGFYSE
ncbi:MAG: hypothetical protein V7696_11265 [Halioglobus sp.]